MKELIFFFCIFCIFPGCSVFISRFYSQPEEHVKKVTDSDKKSSYRINPAMRSFENKLMPSVFEDSIDHSVVRIWLNNEYESYIFGPPVLPFIPHKSGYGHPDNKKSVMENEKDDNLILYLSVSASDSDIVSFIPASFYIKKMANESEAARVVSVSNIPDIAQLIECKPINNTAVHQQWIIRFEPGVHVEDLPQVFLTSLKINNKNFHAEGIRFKKGKKSFYSPLVSF